MATNKVEFNVLTSKPEDIVDYYMGKSVFVTTRNIYIVHPVTKTKFNYGAPVECKVDSWLASQLAADILTVTDKPNVK